MPRFRPDIAALTPYEVGRPIADVARELGLDVGSVVKLASNESPEGPFPGVIEAAAEAMKLANRYPNPDCWDLGHRLAAELGVDFGNLLFGAGSVALLAEIAQSVGGSGTKAVYGWPGFVMYRFVSAWAMTKHVEIPLDDDYELDLEAIAAAVDDDTRVVYLCNPNNPTGTIKSPGEIEDFVDAIPGSILVAIDEAYHDYVTDERYQTAIPLALRRPNVVVLRTFSKIYALAAQRIGYAVGQPKTLSLIRRAQAPLTVNQVAQAAAFASLAQPDEVRRRREANAAARRYLEAVFAERGLPSPQSHTNFVAFEITGEASGELAAAFLRRGMIIRPLSRGWMRVTVGSESENRRFVEVLDEVLDAISG